MKTYVFQEIPTQSAIIPILLQAAKIIIKTSILSIITILKFSTRKKSFQRCSIEGFEDGKQIGTLSTYKKTRVTLQTKRKLINSTH